MPGFNIGGAGGLAGGPSNTIEIRRKHRWYFETLAGAAAGGGMVFQSSELLVLQSASRPSFKFEQPEMHHNQEVIRLAGKQDWDPVTMVWYDCEQQPDISRTIYRWLNTVVNMQGITVATPNTYKINASLITADGFGNVSERWWMQGCWPAEVNWQELDYTSTDLLTCEVTMRFDRAFRECTNEASAINANIMVCP